MFESNLRPIFVGFRLVQTRPLHTTAIREMQRHGRPSFFGLKSILDRHPDGPTRLVFFRKKTVHHRSNDVCPLSSQDGIVRLQGLRTSQRGVGFEKQARRDA